MQLRSCFLKFPTLSLNEDTCPIVQLENVLATLDALNVAPAIFQAQLSWRLPRFLPSPSPEFSSSSRITTCLNSSTLLIFSWLYMPCCSYTQLQNLPWFLTVGTESLLVAAYFWLLLPYDRNRDMTRHSTYLAFVALSRPLLPYVGSYCLILAIIILIALVSYFGAHRLIMALIALADPCLISDIIIALIAFISDSYYLIKASVACSGCYYLTLADYHFMVATIKLFVGHYRWRSFLLDLMAIVCRNLAFLLPLFIMEHGYLSQTYMIGA